MKDDNKNKGKDDIKLSKLYLVLFPCLLIILIICLLCYRYDIPTFIITCCIGIISTIVVFVILMLESRRMRNAYKRMMAEESSVAIRTTLNGSLIPCVLCNEHGQILAKNKLFTELYNEKCIDKVINVTKLEFKEHSIEKKIGDKIYTINISPVERKYGSVISRVLFLEFIDITELRNKEYEYEAIKPIYVRVFVDNYDDMSLENDITSINVLNQIEGKLIAIANDVADGICRRETRAFTIIFEARNLSSFEVKIEKLLNEIHQVKTGNEQSASLSVGVGCGNSIKESAKMAAQAVEQAQNRGGDQCVILDNYDGVYKYYGEGKIKNESNNSRVAASVNGDLLRESIFCVNDVYIMGHTDEDTDCLGSAFALMSYIINECKKRAFFVCSKSASELESAIQTAFPEWIKGFIISPDDAVAQEKDGDLLIIVDVQNEFLLPSRELYKRLSNSVVLIDHHRPGNNPVKGSVMSYTNHLMSSTCEMITEMLQLISKERRPIGKFEATALLAGIAMDTKGFVFNTSRRTYEAAAYLKKCNADTLDAMRMYQDDKSRYEEISKLVTTAVISNNIAISVSEHELSDDKIVAARAADTLIMIKGVSASFVLIKTSDNVLISARSTGDVINVQRVCEELGGGGHMRSAGVTIKNVSCDKALEMLTQTIEKHIGKQIKG